MRRFQVVFVLGGPGSGKGTQSGLIEKAFGFTHLSAGQLLRDEQERPSSQFGATIRRIIEDGKIVPSSITIQLLKNQMQAVAGKGLFVIDGFPRNLENYRSWGQLMQEHASCPFMLHLKCSEEEMLRRLEIRAKEGRSDDTPEIIKKRFRTYRQDTLAVVSQFEKERKVRSIDADQSVETIFEQIKAVFQAYHPVVL